MKATSRRLICLAVCLALLITVTGCSRQRELIAERKEEFVEQAKDTSDAIYAEAEAKIQTKHEAAATPSPTPETTPSFEDYIEYGAALEAIEQIFDGAVADFYDESQLNDAEIKEISDNKGLRIDSIVLFSTLVRDGTMTEEEFMNSLNQLLEGYVEFVRACFD